LFIDLLRTNKKIVIGAKVVLSLWLVLGVAYLALVALLFYAHIDLNGPDSEGEAKPDPVCVYFEFERTTCTFYQSHNPVWDDLSSFVMEKISLT